MRTVWKYSIEVEKDLDPIFQIPGGGHFLHLKERTIGNTGQVSRTSIIDTWWAVDSDSPLVEVQLFTRGTGLAVPNNVDYLGSVHLGYGVVLHIWQENRRFEDMEIKDGRFVPKTTV